MHRNPAHRRIPVCGAQAGLRRCEGRRPRIHSPAHFVLNYMNSREDRQNINDGRFTAYREFSADTSIDFGAENSDKK